MDLCILGGATHPVFPEEVARAWLSLGDSAREKLIADRTSSMVDDGLLVKDTSDGHDYVLSPELGITIAARCRPAFVVTAGAGRNLRPFTFFALSDQVEPMHGLVAEVPAPPPSAVRKHILKRLGPLGWVYTYALVNPDKAAYMLAEWVCKVPPDSASGSQQQPYVVSLFRAGDGITPAVELPVAGDGTTARVTGAGVDGEFDKEGLKGLMLRMFAQGTQTD
jgi:hypothetical protein